MIPLRTALIFGGLALALGVPLGLVAQKEHLRAKGTRILLELAPADPRSLIQGDYMSLDWRVARDARNESEQWDSDGTVVVRVDPEGVATYVRRHGREPLAPDEKLLRYRKRDDWGRIRIASDAYYFQEGTADLYAHAKYGEVRVKDDGDTLLIGLCDSDRNPLGASLYTR